MNRFSIVDTPITGLKRVERQPRVDLRGTLVRVFCAEEMAAAGWSHPIAQINHTVTHRAGTVRGLHFQRKPYLEMKLVTCLRGVVWDVAVDIRSDSPTFLQWHAVELSATNRTALLIPEGFAHGFQTLTGDCELLYLHSTAYSAEAEGGLNVGDPRLSITWPLAITEISDRDAAHTWLDDKFLGVTL